LPTYQPSASRSIANEEQLLSLSLEDALQILAQPKRGRGQGAAKALLKELGARNDFDEALASDIVGDSSKAGKIDKRLASESSALSNVRPATRLATAILMYSFGGLRRETLGINDPLTPGVTESELLDACVHDAVAVQDEPRQSRQSRSHRQRTDRRRLQSVRGQAQSRQLPDVPGRRQRFGAGVAREV